MVTHISERELNLIGFCLYSLVSLAFADSNKLTIEGILIGIIPLCM